MKTRLLFLTACFTLITLAARAADIAGKWHAQFDTEIGQQTYTYEFVREGENLTGTAHYKNPFNSGTVALKALKVDGDRIAFREELNFDGMPLVITYQGTIAGDEMKLTRQVADIATEQLVAHRAPAE